MSKSFNFIKQLLWFVAVAFAVLGSLYFFRDKPCALPIPYHVGTFDSRFGIRKENFLNAIDQASHIWEVAIEKDLFVYDQKGDLSVSLVYDDRQKETQSSKNLTQFLEDVRTIQDKKSAEIDALKVQYETTVEDYQILLTQYKQKKATYDAEVRDWNSRGGAPKSEYSRLNSERNDLITLQATLEAKRQEVNQLADQVAGLVSEYNVLVRENNARIDEYNRGKYVGKEFDQGLYTQDKDGTSINIYQFSDQAKLVRVLAHELGHALGLEHNDNPKSIMYRLNQDTNEKLSPEDLLALKQLCGIK